MRNKGTLKSETQSSANGERPPTSSVFIELIKYGTAGLVAAVATLGVGSLEFANKGRELDIRMVQIGLSILKGDSDHTNTYEARKFALAAIEKYSAVRIPPESMEAWARGPNLQVPPQAIQLSSGGGLFQLPIVYEAMRSTIGADGTVVQAPKVKSIELDVK